MPKVSVIIPTCNRPEYITKAINSVLQQTYQDFEIIVIDDGLKHRAGDVVKSIKDSRIRYIEHDKNKGGAAARNTGIKLATGEFIAFLGDDDEWLKEKLKIQMSRFEFSTSDVGFCFSAVVNLKDGGTSETSVLDGIHDFHELSLKKMNGFLTVTLIIKRNVFLDIGMFDESLPSHQDPDLIIRITESYKGLGINVPLVSVNMKSGRDSIGRNALNRIKGRLLIIEKYKNEFEERPKVLAQHYFQLGLWYRDLGSYEKAKVYFKESISSHVNYKHVVHYLYAQYLHKKNLIRFNGTRELSKTKNNQINLK